MGKCHHVVMSTKSDPIPSVVATLVQHPRADSTGSRAVNMTTYFGNRSGHYLDECRLLNGTVNNGTIVKWSFTPWELFISFSKDFPGSIDHGSSNFNILAIQATTVIRFAPTYDTQNAVHCWDLCQKISIEHVITILLFRPKLVLLVSSSVLSLPLLRLVAWH